MATNNTKATNSSGQGMYDLLLVNGHIIDPANNVDMKGCVAVKDGAIAAVGADLPRGGARKVVDVGGGYITPGLIDIHSHVYPLLPRPAANVLLTVDADTTMLRSGVTTTVDVGTAGWRDFLHFKEQVIDVSKIRILALINVASKGMIDMTTEQDPAQMHPEITAEVAKQYKDEVVGIKCAHYWVGKPFDDIHTPWASVDNGLRAAELCDMPFMIDFQPNYEPPGRTYEDLILKKLRPGDIHTHVYAKQFPVIGEDGKVLPHMWEARKRGVYFDVGHGGGSFWFRNGVPALEDGFYPDTLSTDMHVSSIRFAGLDQLQVMSKFMAMGMPLAETVMRSTSEAAKLIRRPELGNLSVGACADIAVIRVLKGDFGYVDCGMARLRGDSKLDCMMTIRGGQILFDPNGLSLPDWQDAPDFYWDIPFIPPGTKQPATPHRRK
ncbi:MAG: amidohydrolase/deacetylase family metallohydrolase [Oscillospiraceae bacterium]|nr:amidohydrolase/deacetylase family metallohydrolase [Oscillospiraceae bacterium]